MVIYYATRQEKYEGNETIAFAGDVETAKRECEKHAAKFQDDLGWWRFEQDPWPLWIADVDDITSYVISMEQVLGLP